MSSERKSGSGWSKTDSYDVDLGFLQYDDSCFLSMPIEVRERHLLPDTDTATIWSFGDQVDVRIESNRDKIRIEVATEKFGFIEPDEMKFRGRNNGLIPVLSVSELLPSRETLEGVVNVLEASSDPYYTDEGKITYDDARKHVRRFDDKYSDRRSRVKARDICRKMDINSSKHNLHRIGQALGERYEAEQGKGTKRYKVK